MINKKRRINFVLILICIISLIKLSLTLINNNSIYYEKNEFIKGKIINIINYDDKVIYDIKNKSKYRVTFYDKCEFEIGDIVKIYGKVKIPSNNTLFNLFNYRNYLLSINIKYIVNGNNIVLIKKNNNLLYNFKNYLKKHIDKYKSKTYLKTFIMADQSSIEKEYKNIYKNLGISHLFAISGMHVNFFLLLFDNFLKNNKYKSTIIFLFMIFLLFITNYTVSLLRCISFLFICFINKKYSLKYKKSDLLILTFFILLLYNSYLIYNTGFIFSFAITFFLLSIKNKKSLFYTSLISFLSSVPILALFYFKVNILSLIYNLFFIPIITIIIFPYSILTFIFPILDTSFYNLMNLFNIIITYFGKINILSFTISKPNLLIIILYYISLYLFIKKNKKYIILYILIFLININSRFFIITSSVTFIDVGQGDSSLIILPKGKTILIDTGGIYNTNNYSIAENKIIPYLNSYGINKIDLLILTHGDYDHMGEAINLINNLEVENIVFNYGKFNDLEKELIEVLNKRKIFYYSGIEKLNIDGNELYFLNNNDYGDENDNSSVIYIEFNRYKFLFMADAGIKVEADLIKKYNLRDIDVLKVGHHGSKTSSSKDFIDKINPKYGVISVGKNNHYGHPHESVLENLENLKIYRTDQDGSIIFKIKKNKLDIKTCVP